MIVTLTANTYWTVNLCPTLWPLPHMGNFTKFSKQPYEVGESEVSQSCPTLCDPMDCSLPGSFVHRTFQARVGVGLLFTSPGDLPYPGIKLGAPHIAGRHFIV